MSAPPAPLPLPGPLAARVSGLVRTPWALPALLLLALAVHSVARKAGADFIVFHLAGERALAGAPLYLAQDVALPFKYAPAAALVFGVLAPVPFAVARALFALLSVAALVRLLCWCAKGTGLGWRGVLAVTLVFLPSAHALLARGQCDALLLWLMLESEERAEAAPWTSGLLWALACLFKLPFLVLLPVVLVLRQGRRLAGLGLGLAVGLVAPAAVYGWQGNLALLAAWRALLAETTPPLLCAPDNQGLAAVVCRYGPSPGVGPSFQLALLAAAVLVVGAFALLVLRRARGGPEGARRLVVQCALYLSAFLSPLGWRSNLLALMPLYTSAAGASRRVRGRRRWLAALALGAFALVQALDFDVLGREAFTRLLSLRHLGLGGLVSALAATWLLSRPEREAAG